MFGVNKAQTGHILIASGQQAGVAQAGVEHPMEAATIALAGAEAHKAAEPLIAFFAPKHFVGNTVHAPVAFAVGAIVFGK